ncbi:MAG: sufD [Fibrobacteria bacterium]|jgi:hypothetical protein|nr:sufD [Fibrobacteria bacterium]
MTETAAIPTPFNMRATHVPDVPETLRRVAESLRKAHPSPALRELREAAWTVFESMGVPQNGHEDFSFVSSADLKGVLNRLPDGKLLAPEISSATTIGVRDEVDSGWMELLKAESDAPAALAAALAPAPREIALADKDQVRVVLAGSLARADHALRLDVPAHAKASVSFVLENPEAQAFVNAVVYLRLGAGATLDVSVSEAAQGFQLLKIGADLRRDAQLNLLTVSTGSRLARVSIDAALREPGASLDARGAAVAAGANRSHRHLRIRHAAPDCVSKQLFKTVVPGPGRSSMDGTVFVDPGAQRTDARQLLQHLLLSKEGRADAKPRLLIHADDVKCSHGATVGKTDPAQKFYLLSRGLDARTADRLLTQAFLNEALEIFPDEATADARARLMDAIGVEAK